MNSLEGWHTGDIVLTGDFNCEIPEVQAAMKPGVNYHLGGEVLKPYNSENRVQQRFRDGWSGLQVI